EGHLDQRAIVRGPPGRRMVPGPSKERGHLRRQPGTSRRQYRTWGTPQESGLAQSRTWDTPSVSLSAHDLVGRTERRLTFIRPANEQKRRNAGELCEWPRDGPWLQATLMAPDALHIPDMNRVRYWLPLNSNTR